MHEPYCLFRNASFNDIPPNHLKSWSRFLPTTQPDPHSPYSRSSYLLPTCTPTNCPRQSVDRSRRVASHLGGGICRRFNTNSLIGRSPGSCDDRPLCTCPQSAVPRQSHSLPRCLCRCQCLLDDCRSPHRFPHSIHTDYTFRRNLLNGRVRRSLPSLLCGCATPHSISSTVWRTFRSRFFAAPCTNERKTNPHRDRMCPHLDCSPVASAITDNLVVHSLTQVATYNKETEFFLQNSVSSRSQSGFKVMVESIHHGQLRIDNHGNHFIT